MKQSQTSHFILAIILAIVFAACGNTAKEEPIDINQVKTDIQAMETNFQDAVNAKDIDALMGYYADDAVSYAPFKAARVGGEAIRADNMEAMNDTSGSILTLTTKEVFAAGNYVTEIGHYALQGPDGQSWGSGPYMSLFEKRDGKYVCIRDIWNSDMPKKMKDDDDEDDDEDDEEDEGEDDEDGDDDEDDE